MKLACAFRAGVLLLAAVGVGLVLLLLPVRSYLQGFLERVGGMGPGGPVLLGAAYALAVVLFVPGSLLTLGAGFLFGVVVGPSPFPWRARWGPRPPSSWDGRWPGPGSSAASAPAPASAPSRTPFGVKGS